MKYENLLKKFWGILPCILEFIKFYFFFNFFWFIYRLYGFDWWLANPLWGDPLVHTMTHKFYGVFLHTHSDTGCLRSKHKTFNKIKYSNFLVRSGRIVFNILVWFFLNITIFSLLKLMAILMAGVILIFWLIRTFKW